MNINVHGSSRCPKTQKWKRLERSQGDNKNMFVSGLQDSRGNQRSQDYLSQEFRFVSTGPKSLMGMVLQDFGPGLCSEGSGFSFFLYIWSPLLLFDMRSVLWQSQVDDSSLKSRLICWWLHTSLIENHDSHPISHNITNNLLLEAANSIFR